MHRRGSRFALAGALAWVLLPACRGDDAEGGDGGAPADAAQDGAPADAGPDALRVDDGPPVRRPCTSRFGQALTEVHGRLDGILVAVVPPGTPGCNSDADHLHLQVELDGAVYDVAINISDPQDVAYLARDLEMPHGPWVQGWHTGLDGTLDYPSLGVHAGDFTPVPKAQLLQKLTAELATVNHISVFMTAYGPDGGHNVHRRGANVDGALALEPLSPQAHLLMFHFASQGF